METSNISKNRIIAELTRSSHGNLQAYTPIALTAAKEQPEFLAHLIAWNAKNGAIRDSKIALPVASLGSASFPDSFAENSYAHIAQLRPREFIAALDYGRSFPSAERGRAYRRLVERYIRHLEGSFPLWERAVIQHRKSIKTLYARWHVKPSPICQRALFDRQYPAGSTLSLIPQLAAMPAREAAGYILQRKIPFLVVVGAVGDKLKDTDLTLALIERMTPTELITNTKMLERMGVKNNPALRGAYEAGLKRVAEAPKGAAPAFKTERAIAAVSDESTKERLRATQEKQLKTLGGVDGDWLVLGDKSGSMQQAIQTAQQVAAALAKMVKGKVHFVFFDTEPYYYDVTGLSYDQIIAKTLHIRAQGGTSPGAGLRYIRERKIPVQGIAVVSDGGENRIPSFTGVYAPYCEELGIEPVVYFYRLEGDIDSFTGNLAHAGIDAPTFDLRGGVDYYSLPSLIATMNTRRYTLVDAIMETPLLTLSEVFA